MHEQNSPHLETPAFTQNENENYFVNEFKQEISTEHHLNPDKNETSNEFKFEFPQLDIECLEIKQIKSAEEIQDLQEVNSDQNIGTEQLKNLELDQFEEQKMKFLGDSIPSLDNITEEKTIEGSSNSNPSNILSTTYIKNQLNQIDRRMTKTDFKGNLILNSSNVSDVKSSETSPKDSNNTTSPNFTAPLKESLNKSNETPNFSKKVSSSEKIISNEPIPEKKIIIQNPFLPKENTNNNNNNFSRPTFIPFKKIKNLKSDLNMNSKMDKHKEKLLQLTNPNKLDEVTSSSSEHLSDDFQDNDNIDIHNLNFFINKQLNPHMNQNKLKDKSQNWSRKSSRENFQVNF